MSALLFDSHAHYFDKRFGDPEDDIDELLRNEVFGKNVGYVVNVGTNPTNSGMAIAMAQKYPGMYATVGIHPEDSQFLESTPEEAIGAIEELLADAETRKKKKIVALGEIGLDYHEWAGGGFIPDKPLQKLYFERQLELADRLGLPVVIHDRDAHGDCFETVLKFPNVTGVFHCYGGSSEMARELMRRGWYISFSGVVTFKNAARVREVARSIDLDKLLIETDAPYLAPHPFRGKRNHSGLMQYTAEALAELRGIDTDDLITRTAENAARLYGIEL